MTTDLALVPELPATALPEGIGAWQKPVRKVLGPVVRLMWKLDVQGLENIPTDGPAVICANHISVIDSFFVPAVLPRGITYVGKAEYLDDWKTSTLFPKLGMIPIDRRGGDHAAAALDAARGVLQSGGLFGIYPEGTRSRSGFLHKGHTGAARLAIETGAPIIPVGLIGTDEVQPTGASAPRPFMAAKIHFGRPIPVERYADRAGDRAVYRELIDEVMYEIRELSGQEYSHTYAGSAETPVAEPVPTAASHGAPTSGDVLILPPQLARQSPAGANEATFERKSSASVLAPRPLVVAS